MSISSLIKVISECRVATPKVEARGKSPHEVLQTNMAYHLFCDPNRLPSSTYCSFRSRVRAVDVGPWPPCCLATRDDTQAPITGLRGSNQCPLPPNMRFPAQLARCLSCKSRSQLFKARCQSLQRPIAKKKKKCPSGFKQQHYSNSIRWQPRVRQHLANLSLLFLVNSLG